MHPESIIKFPFNLPKRICKQYLHHSIFILQIDFSKRGHKKSNTKSGNSKRKGKKISTSKSLKSFFSSSSRSKKKSTNLLLKNFLFFISYQLEIKFNGMELCRTLKKFFFLTPYPSMGTYASIDFLTKKSSNGRHFKSLWMLVERL